MEVVTALLDELGEHDDGYCGGDGIVGQVVEHYAGDGTLSGVLWIRAMEMVTVLLGVLSSMAMLATALLDMLSSMALATAWSGMPCKMELVSRFRRLEQSAA
ncbi:hypothetical protein PHYPSEUDO_003499 [Phytophthora pseudosyringae]|uniref:Uncharacterized protein n=1 Tax=Phytophthora pseudosyringae TaxID=221518 RepID=A0A8T1VVR0_9STRA|nr:hypothetical protein PHYPSEUDO_003499 [Phytophthora pseudosyringae]